MNSEKTLLPRHAETLERLRRGIAETVGRDVSAKGESVEGRLWADIILESEMRARARSDRGFPPFISVRHFDAVQVPGYEVRVCPVSLARALPRPSGLMDYVPFTAANGELERRKEGKLRELCKTIESALGADGERVSVSFGDVSYRSGCRQIVKPSLGMRRPA